MGDNYLDMCLPLPPDVDMLVQHRGSWSGSSCTSSTATPASSIDTPPTGTKPKLRAPAKSKGIKSKPLGGTKLLSTGKQPSADVASKRRPTPGKQQQDEIPSDKQLAKEALRREKEARAAAMRRQDLPEGPFVMVPKRPASPRKRSRKPPQELTTSKDAEMALLLGLAGMKPAPRSFAMVDDKQFVASAPAIA